MEILSTSLTPFRHSRFTTTLSLVFLATTSINALIIAHKGQPSNLPITLRQDAPGCSFAGNPDIYGLGIRVGIYLQLVSSLIANRFVMEAVGDSSDTNTIFIFAVFLAAVTATVQGTLQPIEIVVLLYIVYSFFLTAWSMFGFRTSGRSMTDKFTEAGIFFRSGVVAAISVYSVWFWFQGLPKLRIADDQCASYVFLFAKVDLTSPVATKFFQLFSVLSIVLCGPIFLLFSTFFLVETVRFLYSIAKAFLTCGTLRKLVGQECCLWIRYNSSSDDSTPLPDINSLDLVGGRGSGPGSLEKLAEVCCPHCCILCIKYVSHYHEYINLACLIWFIIAIELTLLYNSISGVYDLRPTGQLIPFIIGIVGLVKVLHILILNSLKEMYSVRSIVSPRTGFKP
jgi:hypothetical protein